MTLHNLPEWRALASIAGGVIGSTDPDTLRGILAQWTCEQRGTWPPTRNNPGNNAKGWADGVGIPYTVEHPNPQPSNPIVTYATPALGARAYGLGLAHFGRYSAAIAAARAGNGAGFLRAVTSAGYGTSYTCSIGAYRALGGTNTSYAPPGDTNKRPAGGAPSGGGSSSSGAYGTIVSLPARTVAACSSPVVIQPGPFDGITGIYPIPPDKVGKPCVQCAPGYNLAVINPNIALPFVWVPADQLAPGVANGCAKAGLKPGDRAGLSPDPSVLTGQLGAAIAAAIGGIPDALGNVFRSTALLVAILALALVGLWLLVGDRVPVQTVVKAAALA